MLTCVDGRGQAATHASPPHTPLEISGALGAYAAPQTHACPARAAPAKAARSPPRDNKSQRRAPNRASG
jgi:hypothetical protein